MNLFSLILLIFSQLSPRFYHFHSNFRYFYSDLTFFTIITSISLFTHNFTILAPNSLFSLRFLRISLEVHSLIRFHSDFQSYFHNFQSDFTIFTRGFTIFTCIYTIFTSISLFLLRFSLKCHYFHSYFQGTIFTHIFSHIFTVFTQNFHYCDSHFDFFTPISLISLGFSLYFHSVYFT